MYGRSLSAGGRTKADGVGAGGAVVVDASTTSTQGSSSTRPAADTVIVDV